MANQDSFQRSGELSILRPRIAGTAQLCAGSAGCKRSGDSAGSTYLSFDPPCSAPSKADDVHVEFTPWRMSHSQFRYRGQPNVIDLGEL